MAYNSYYWPSEYDMINQASTQASRTNRVDAINVLGAQVQILSKEMEKYFAAYVNHSPFKVRESYGGFHARTQYQESNRFASPYVEHVEYE